MPRRPIDILHLTVLLVLLVLCLGCAAAGRLPGWPAYAGIVVAMLAGLWGVVRLERDSPLGAGPAGALRTAVAELYPAAFVPLVFTVIGPLIPAVNPAADPGRDGWLIAADRFVFGADPTLWLERLVRPWLTDVMYVAYCCYFLMPFAVAAAVWRRGGPGRLGAFRQYVFVVVMSFYVSYVGYFLVPAQGPRVALENEQTIKLRQLQATPVSRAIADGMNAVEHNKNDVFPSGHVMLTAVCLLLALRQSRRLFLVLLPIGLGVFVSTVYCRYHYVVDVIAGLALAGPMPWVGGRVYGWLAGDKVRG